ncbi:cordon-bleu protein-like 1b [Danio aesculapii]|uniref:cordon-bleu protein-like 1b n=1 Tax=Danio aesculapii TaxID=1142201 RepID=UPI0024C0CBE2|nr:cordon-bleu protein-like 1b [Danio aesculapii]
MTVDSRAKLQRRSRARDFRAAAGMEGNAHSRPPDRRRSTKSKAPPPPVLTGLDAPLLSHKLPVFPHPAMEQTESLLEQELTLTVILPGGAEKTTTVHGRFSDDCCYETNQMIAVSQLGGAAFLRDPAPNLACFRLYMQRMR